jgi:hypothetical protein
MLKYHLMAAPLLALALATPAFAQSNDPSGAAEIDSTEFELSTGADYSIGSYGAATDTTVWSIPVEAKLRSGNFRISASLPYVSIKGPGRVVGGVVVFDPSSTTPVNSSGIGDLSVASGYLLNRESGALPAFELGGTVKIPTASAQIGTGEVDYSVQMSAFKTVAPGTLLFGSVGYSWLGSPATYQLNNGITATAGVNYKPSPRTDLGASFSYREPVATGLQSQAVIAPYLTQRVSNRFGITLYGMAGLNEASPRLGAGVRLSLFN